MDVRLRAVAGVPALAEHGPGRHDVARGWPHGPAAQVGQADEGASRCDGENDVVAGDGRDPLLYPLSLPGGIYTQGLRDFWERVDFTNKLVNSTVISVTSQVSTSRCVSRKSPGCT